MMNLLQIKSLVTERYRRTTFKVVVLMYIAGTIGLFLPATQTYFKLASPFNLWVSLILLLLFHKDFNKSFISTVIIIFLTGFLVEVLGVHTGVIFGKYWYGQTLGTKLFGVPIVIGANWLLLIYCSSVIVLKIFEILTKYLSNNFFLNQAFIKAIFAATLMVFLDYLIEPVAVSLDFWHWEFEKIPVQNFQAWFLVAFILNYLFINNKFLKSNSLAGLLLFLQFFFFISIHIFNLLSSKK